MTRDLLISAILRDFASLMAALATTELGRASLAGVTHGLFHHLVQELDARGVTKRVMADVFNLPLTTLQRRVQTAAVESLAHHQPVQAAIVGVLSDAEWMTRDAILAAFPHEDERITKAIVRDLVKAGVLLQQTRHGVRGLTVAPETREHLAGLTGAQDAVVLIMVCRMSPVRRLDLIEELRLDPEAVDASLRRLLAAERLERDPQGRYCADEMAMVPGQMVGWQAAVYDHLHAVFETLRARLDAQDEGPLSSSGSTYWFDVWPGHPHYDEVLARLGETRDRLDDLWQRVEDHNAEHAPPDDVQRVAIYLGRTTRRDDSNTKK